MSRRPYHSPLREARAEETRRQVLEAAEALLTEAPIEELSIPKVAKRAGVSAPTVYRYFPTTDDLLRAFIDHVRPRLGMGLDQIAAYEPAELPALPRETFRRFERVGDLLRSVMDSATWNRIRLEQPKDRAGAVLGHFTARAPRLDERALRAALGPVYLLATPSAWRWLRETWGLSATDSAKAAAWAIGVLARELLEDPPSIEPVDLEEER